MIDEINDADGLNRSRRKRAVHVGGHIESLSFRTSLLCQALKEKIQKKKK